MTCVRCGQTATVHLTELFPMPPLVCWVSFGRFPEIKRERNLCESCARAEGLPVGNLPVGELLKAFTEAHEQGRSLRPPE